MSRHTIETMLKCLEFNRGRTLGTLDAIAELPDAAAALGWRPGEGRAHIAWQLMHIGITEELFATERITGQPPGFADDVPRYRGGSTPDDDIPGVDQIRDVLAQTREHFQATMATFSDADLTMIPEPITDRGWSLGRVLEVMNWHESHHQGQAHAILNLYKAHSGL